MPNGRKITSKAIRYGMSLKTPSTPLKTISKTAVLLGQNRFNIKICFKIKNYFNYKKYK